MSDSAPRLPARPSLAQLRKQAKELRRAFREGHDAAVRRVHAIIPRSADSTSRTITLADTQFVLAREHGFASWANLVHHIEAQYPPGIAKYERLAEEIARAYMAGDAGGIRDVNAANGTSFIWDFEPARMQRRLRTWYASTSRSHELALDDARLLVAKQCGVDSWDDLVRATALESKAERGAGQPVRSDTPFHHIDEQARAIDVRGPLTEADWDTILGVMREMRLTSLRGAGQISDRVLERLSHLYHVTDVELSFLNRATVENNAQFVKNLDI